MPDLSKKSRKSRGKYKLSKNDSTKKIKGGFPNPFSGIISGIGNFLSSLSGAKKDINTTADKFADLKAEIEKHITALTGSLNNVKPLLDACGASINTIEKSTNDALEDQKAAKPSLGFGPEKIQNDRIEAPGFGGPENPGQPGQPDRRAAQLDDDIADPYEAPKFSGGSSCSAPKKSRKKRSKKPKN
jgi:hypothetical protein